MDDRSRLRREELEANREVFLLRVVADLGHDRRAVADTWEPPMTAAGRHVALAREFESRLRAMWLAYGNLDRLGSQQPLFRESLRRFDYSDDAFRFLPADGCEELLRLRKLFVEIVDAGLE
jgi:hypothetical protein